VALAPERFLDLLTQRHRARSLSPMPATAAVGGDEEL
jgi:hypothetical protein